MPFVIALFVVVVFVFLAPLLVFAAPLALYLVPAVALVAVAYHFLHAEHTEQPRPHVINPFHGHKLYVP